MEHVGGADRDCEDEPSRRRKRQAIAIISQLARGIDERELNVVRRELAWSEAECRIESIDAGGPGNALLLEVERTGGVELVAGFGERGVPAEKVAARAVAELRSYFDANVPVGRHLADQIMVPMAVAGGGRFSARPAWRKTCRRCRGASLSDPRRSRAARRRTELRLQAWAAGSASDLRAGRANAQLLRVRGPAPRR